MAPKFEVAKWELVYDSFVTRDPNLRDYFLLPILTKWVSLSTTPTSKNAMCAHNFPQVCIVYQQIPPVIHCLVQSNHSLPT